MAFARFEGFRGTGFDGDVIPPWQGVSTLAPYSIKLVSLVDGIGWTISSSNESVATIAENGASNGGSRLFDVKGIGRGVAYVMGKPPGGGPPRRLLEVEVKPKRVLKIAFNFVVDSHLETTVRPTIPHFMNQLRNNTNELFENQANLTIDVTREKEIQVRTSLRDIIGKQNRGELGLSGYLKGPYQEWYKLLEDADRDAEINVFFMPRSIAAKENTYPPVVFGMDGNIVIEDDPGRRIDRVERDVAHWIAYLLGCSRKRDRRKPDHLMSLSDDVTARFISKEDAGVLNQTT